MCSPSPCLLVCLSVYVGVGVILLHYHADDLANDPDMI